MTVYIFDTITAQQALTYNAATDDLFFADYSQYVLENGGVEVDEAAQTIAIYRNGWVTFGAGLFGETVYYRDGAILAFGTQASELLVGPGQLFGAGGADTLQGVSTSALYGGSGDDRLIGGLGANTLYGGEGDDTFVILTGHGGVVSGGVLYSGDRIRDWQVGDRIAFATGSTGADYIEITATSYEAAKTAANAQIATGAINFVAAELSLGSGLTQVVIFADTRNDDGGADDIIDLTFANLSSISAANIVGGAAPAVVSAGPSTVTSTYYDDNLTGGAGDDSISGMTGNDSLSGGAGRDTLDGGGDMNVIRGGPGADRLAHGSYYVFEPGDSSTHPGQIDTIDWDYYGTAYPKIIFTFEPTGTDYTEATAASYADALILANGLIAAGTYNFVVVDVGSSAYLFVDSRNDNGDADDAIKLEGLNYLSEISAANIGGPSSLPAPPEPWVLLEGTVGNDTLIAGNTGSSVLGGEGDDLLMGGIGNDTLIGGGGLDTVSFANATSAVTVSLATIAAQSVGGGLGVDIVYAPERLIGSAYDDLLEAGSSSATILGGAGADTITKVVQSSFYSTGQVAFYGEDGNDSLSASSYDAILLSGGGGDDTISGITNSGAGLQLFGGAGNDRLSSNGGSVLGDEGADTLTTTYSGSLEGGDGADSLVSTYGGATLLGGAGEDTLTTGFSSGSSVGGASTLEGGASNDIINHFASGGTALGGDGDDVIARRGDRALVDGGAGVDRLDYSNSAWVKVDLRPGQSGTDTVTGVEMVIGSAFADTITGASGADTLQAGGGDDILSGGAGDDVLDGGAGNDILSYAGATGGVNVTLNSAAAQAVGGGDGTDSISGFEALVGSAFDDTLTAAAAGSGLSGGAGSDLLLSGAGADTFYMYTAGVSAASDTVMAGAGDLVEFGVSVSGAFSASAVALDLVGGTARVAATGALAASDHVLSGVTRVNGSHGDDTLVGSGGGETLSGGRGSDVIAGQGGDDLIIGDGLVTTSFVQVWNGSNYVSVFEGPNALSGGDGNDTLQGGNASNGILGDAGNDSVVGGEYDDAAFGGSGDDTLAGGAGWGYDDLEGEAGNDLIYLQGWSSGYLRGGEGDDTLTGGLWFDDLHGNQGDDVVRGGDDGDWVVGGKDHDRLYGEGGHDVVLGNLGADTCEGGEGDDVVRGGKDDDVVLGQAGNDFVSGDRGNDTMTGGTGADRFHVFDGSGYDLVTDFSVAEGDRVFLLAGTHYTVAQVGADTVVTVTDGEGGQLVLIGVSASSLPPGWIFTA